MAPRSRSTRATAPAGELVNPESGRCLTDPSNGANGSTQLDIAACTSSVGQLWTLPSG
jgi:hypothetical protein